MAIHAGHADVEQHELRRLLPEKFQRLGSAVRFAYQVLVAAQEGRKERGGIDVVVDHQNAQVVERRVYVRGRRVRTDVFLRERDAQRELAALALPFAGHLHRTLVQFDY